MVATYPPYSLPKVSLLEILINNILFTRQNPMEINVDGIKGEIIPIKFPYSVKYTSFFSILIGNQECYFAFQSDDFIYNHSVFDEIENKEDMVLPLGLKQALCESMFEPYINFLSNQFQSNVKINNSFFIDDNLSEDVIKDEALTAEKIQKFFDELLLSKDKPYCKIPIKFKHEKFSNENSPFYIDIFIPIRMELNKIIDKLNLLPVKSNYSFDFEKKDIPYLVSFESGYVMLPKKEILSLQVGDIILPDDYYFRDNNPKIKLEVQIDINLEKSVSQVIQENVININSQAFTFCSVNENLAIVENSLQVKSKNISLLNKNGVSMENNTENLENKQDLSEDVNEASQNESQEFKNIVNEFESLLTFELERRVLNLSDIKNITTGYTFAMGVDKNSPITLRVNGKAIGKGRLIEMDSMLGVQVTEIGG